MSRPSFLLVLLATTSPAFAQSFADPPPADLPARSPMPLLTLLMDLDGGNDPGTREDVWSELYGCDADPSRRCMNGYWRESSYGQFEFEDAGVIDWIPAWDDPNTVGDESTLSYWWAAKGGHGEEQGGFRYRMWALHSLRASGVDVHGLLTQYDADGDGTVELGDELAILVIDNRGTCGGAARWGALGIIDRTYVSGGIAVTHGDEIGGCGTKAPFYIYAHELGHTIWDGAVWDAYADWNLPDPITAFTLYGGDYGPLHVPAWHKMKMGWMEPYTDVIVPTRDGWYELPSLETSPSAILLHDPAHGEHEYFVVENRWAGDSYDDTSPGDPTVPSGLQDEGLVVWHIDEKAPIVGTVGATDHTRVQLVHRTRRPGQHGGDYSTAAFHGWTTGEPGLHDDWRSYASSRWWDGSRSYVGFWEPSQPGETMRLFVDVPGPGLLIHDRRVEIRLAPGEAGEALYDVTYTDDAGILCDAAWSAPGLPAGLRLDAESFSLSARQTTALPVRVQEVECTPAARYDVQVEAWASMPAVSDVATLRIVVEEGVAPAVAVWPRDATVWPLGDLPGLHDDYTTARFEVGAANRGNVVAPLMLEVAPAGSVAAEPSQLSLGWTTKALPWRTSDLLPCEGEARHELAFQVPAAEFAAYDDVSYPVRVAAIAEDGAEATELVHLTVKATTGSRIRWLRRTARTVEEGLTTPQLADPIRDLAGKMEHVQMLYELEKMDDVRAGLEDAWGPLDQLELAIARPEGDVPKPELVVAEEFLVEARHVLELTLALFDEPPPK